MNRSNNSPGDANNRENSPRIFQMRLNLAIDRYCAGQKWRQEIHELTTELADCDRRCLPPALTAVDEHP